jgi:hypothetical protein
VGTPKQWMAGARGLLQAVIACLYGQALRFRRSLARTRNIILLFLIFSESQPLHEIRGSSTVC